VNSRLDAFTNTGELAGPPLAGAIAGALGAIWALVLDAGTYLASLVTLYRLRSSDSAPTPRADRPPIVDKPSMSAAARLLWQHRILRYLALGGACSNFALMTLQGISVVYMVRELRLSSLATGLVVACSGIGSAAGAAAAPRLIERWSLRVLILVLAPLAVLGPLSLVTGPESAVTPFVGYGVMGFSIAVVGVVGRRYRQGQIPTEILGRASGVYSTVLMGTLPIGAISGGIVSETAGFDAALYVSASGFAVAALSLVYALRLGFREIA
jgi:predicted MFS family arabinose efflux permease